MVDKSLKYYDVEKLYPKSEYVRDDRTKTKIWGIRLTNEEIEIWKKMKLSKRIHKILTGEESYSNDSNLRNKLEKYHKLFEMIIEKHFTDLDPAIIEFIENNEEFGEEI